MLDQYRGEIGTAIMSQSDPNLVTSGLSGVVTQDGVKVEICNALSASSMKNSGRSRS